MHAVMTTHQLQKIVIASGNQGKLKEIQQILQATNIEVVAQSDFNIPEAEEPHCTFIENALAKARHASQLTGLPALADDSGICVDALHGMPGVHSARYACELPDSIKSDSANNDKLLLAMQHQLQRQAHYYCVMVLVKYAQDPQPIIAEGIWRGEILSMMRGTDGFGYDPLFLDVASGKAAAELPLDIKNRISHRGQALQQLLQKIKLLSL
jgi:XTP/dITP diphosphohydrolase